MIGRAQNRFPTFEKRANQALGTSRYRVFVVMPIQGEKFGTQDEQRIYKECDGRFEAIESTLTEFDCVAIRIDKEHPLEDIVGTIKKEIDRAQFVIADRHRVQVNEDYRQNCVDAIDSLVNAL